MAWWREHVVPRLTDASLSAPEIALLRGRACAPLVGRVLEVGFGSGLNLPHLPSGVASVAAVEPSDLAWRRSARRREESHTPVERIGLDGQSVGAEPGSFHSALVTFSLCTIPDAARALSEVRRLLRPDGILAFLEHGLSPDAGVARWQQRLDRVQALACGGCHLTRDVPELVESSGFTLIDLERRYLVPVPRVGRPWAHGFLGTAQPST